MKNVFVINKKEGETPLQCLESFRMKKKIGKDVPMTYAGRLDPMASGVLIILIGEECKNKERYLGLGKEYEFEVLFGFATDTYDILGKICARKDLAQIKDLEKEIKKNLKFFKGKIVQKYPIYSSKTVAGKQLHEYARAGEEVEAPEREVDVKTLKFKKLRKISSKTLLNNIEKRIAKINGDFRQKEILKIWKRELNPVSSKKGFYVGSFSARVSSGTYIRTISHDLGNHLGIPALAFTIKRTKVGKFANI